MSGTIPQRLLLLFATTMCLRPALSHAQVNVLSNHYDDARTGANLSETTLTAANVTSAGFGKLYSYPVDGSVYAQPLYVSGVLISGVPRNVLYVATMNDKVYAFNADSSSPVPLWTRDFTGPSVTPVPISDIVAPNLNIVGNVGVESTPVIDPGTRTIYLVARTKENGSYVQKLHALDITTGVERPGSPVTITATATGNAPDATGGVIRFDAKMENQRAGLVLANGVVMISWASHQDTTPYHGWVVGYNAATLAQVGAFCVTRDTYFGGIWQSGRAPAVDAAGNVYFVTGNATWDGSRNFGDSVLKFSVSTAGIALTDYFTPSNWATLNANDADLGTTGPMIIPSSNAMVIGGKEGVLYLVNAANLGHETSNDSQIIQRLAQTTGVLKGGPAYWNSPTGGPLVYYWAQSDVLTAFHFNGTTLDALPFATGAAVSPGSPGGALTVSANGHQAGTGVVWASLSTSQNGSLGLVAGIVRAYNAETLQEIWNSEQNSGRDRVGTLMKFVAPVVANGKVFQPNYDGAVVVYGLLPPSDQNQNGLLAAAAVSPGIVHVGGTGQHLVVTNNRMTLTYTPVAANDAVVVLVACRMPGVTGISLTAPGWTITPVSGLIGPNSLFDFIRTFGAIVPTVSPVTFTVTFSGSNGDCSNDGTILIDEFSGNDVTGGTTTFDAHNENIAETGPTCIGAAVSPANDNGAVWFGCYDHVTGVTGGYTRGQDDGIGDGTEYKILTGQLGVPQSPGFATVENFPGFALGGVSIRAASSVAAPDLTVTKTHSGNFRQGQTGAAYSVTVRNTGTAPTSGTVTMTDTLPAGLTATAISGTNWACTLATRVCTRSDALAAGGSYPAITITVNVAGNAAASVTNTATVSGGGETNTANDSATDPTTITPAVPATIRLVQSAFNGNEAGTANMSVSFPSSNTAGNFLIVAATAARPAGTLSISDTLGNTYIPALTPVTDAAQDVTAHIWYVPIARAGANTVTITPTTTSALEIHVSEWSGISSVSPVDQVSSAIGTGTSLSSGAKTTTANGELIFGFGWVANSATAGTGFTPISLINGDLDEYQIQSTAGSIATTFTQQSGAWFALMATFFPAGTSAVIVPNVVSQTQAAATTAITNAGLVVGTVTTASSGTVPAGSVISQTPTAGTQVVAGSAVNLVVSTGSGGGGGAGVDAILFSDGAGTRTITGFNTTAAGDLLVAFVGADGPSSGGQTATVSGANLTWTLVRRVNTQLGTSEIWKATAPGVLSNASITSTLTSSSFHQSLTVVAFSGASGTGASAGGNASSGAPSVSLVTTQPGSLIYGVGNDWQSPTARTLGSGQAMAHQWVDTGTGDTYWVQNRTAPIASAGSTAQLSDTFPTADRWNFVAVEVLMSSSGVSVPNVVSLTQAAATTAITNAGLIVGTVTTASSGTVPSGSVISQTPVAGTSVASGSAVNLVVSTGASNVNVPNVVNLTQASATTAITNAGLVVGTVTTASSTTVPSGSVISQLPTAGTSVAPGSAVNLTVSTGPSQVSVPGVVNLTQSAATTAITNAGLVVGTVTTASSTTVPSGSVISQAPTAGTMVATGSAVNLVVSTGPPSSGISVNATVFSDGLGTRTATVTTTGPNRLLLAFAASDGLSTGGQTLTVSGGGLTWTLVRRVNARLGSSEIWQAFAPSTLSNASITLTQSQTNYRQSLTVVAFAGASGVGASSTANAASGGPTLTVTTTKAGALVYGVGNDYDNAVARTVGSGQTKVHEWVDTVTGDTYWVQARTGAVAAAGTAVTLNDTAPTNDRWNFAVVEVVP